MANKDLNINVYANLIISDETAEKCCRLLEMWMDNDPYRKIVCEAKDESHRTLKLIQWPENDKE